MQKRLCVLLLVILILALGTSYASARYSYTAQLSASLTISGNQASCSGKVQPSDSANTASITVKLQRKVSTTWSTVTLWTATASKPGSTASAAGTYTLTRGYEYRVYVEGTIKDSSGNVLENTSKASAIQTY